MKLLKAKSDECNELKIQPNYIFRNVYCPLCELKIEKAMQCQQCLS